MFDIGWTEMVVVAIIAILFVGPKELPAMLRTFGKTVAKVRSLASDFKGQFNEALKEAELDGVKDTINDVRNLDPTKHIKDQFNPLKDELDEVQKSVNDSVEFDPKEIFDESKAPSAPVPQKVDVEAALERQKKLDAEKLKTEKQLKPAPKPVKKASAKTATKKAAPKKAPAKKTKKTET